MKCLISPAAFFLILKTHLQTTVTMLAFGGESTTSHVFNLSNLSISLCSLLRSRTQLVKYTIDALMKLEYSDMQRNHDRLLGWPVGLVRSLFMRLFIVLTYCQPRDKTDLDTFQRSLPNFDSTPTNPLSPPLPWSQVTPKSKRPTSNNSPHGAYRLGCLPKSRLQSCSRLGGLVGSLERTGCMLGQV